MLPRAFLTPLIPIHLAHKHDNKVLHLAENRFPQAFDKDCLKVVSYNIWRNYRDEAISESLQKIMGQADVILLQEDVVRNPNDLPDRVLASDWNYVYAQAHQVKKKTSYYNFDHSGSTILSRFILETSQVYPLPKAHYDHLGEDHSLQRVAVYARVRKNDGKSIGIYNVHLCNLTRPAGRNRQIQFVLEKVKENADDYVVIGGDFNTYMGPLERALKTVKNAGFKNGSEMNLKPMDLDHIFTSKNFKKRINHPVGDHTQHPGSDHLPTDIVEVWV